MTRWTAAQHHKAAAMLRSAADAETRPAHKAALMAQAQDAVQIAQQMPGLPATNPNETPDLPPDMLTALGITPPQ